MVPQDPVTESSGRGCLLMIGGVALVGLGALDWLGAGLNKTDTTAPLDVGVAVVGLAVMVVGIVRRVMWVRGSD